MSEPKVDPILQAFERVRQVQRDLRDRGHTIAADGLLGPDTIAAIRASSPWNDEQVLAAVRSSPWNDEQVKRGGDVPTTNAVDEFYAKIAGGTTETPLRVFLRDVEQEFMHARQKFPYSGGSMTALTEEVGELAKAMLDEPGTRIYKEAVQTATMAARVALEGDPTLDEYRKQRQGVGATPARGSRR